MNEEFENLVYLHFMGQLTDAQTLTLAQWLDADDQAKMRFVRLAKDQTELHECLATLRNHVPFPTPRPPAKVIRIKPRAPWWPTVLAACLVLSAAIVLLPKWFSPGKNRIAESSNYSVARVAAVTRLESNHDWKVGDILPRGIVEISSGELEILFHSGSTVVLQAPCRVDLNANRSCTLLKGRVTAEVPPFDSGFAIHAPGMSVVDVGTRFGIDSDGGSSELHVLKGTVIATPEGADRGRYLSEKSAVRAIAGPAADLTSIRFAPDRFACLSVPASAGTHAYLHYSFEEPAGIHVEDHGKGMPGGPFLGTIEHGDSSTLRVPGRFGLALALDGRGMQLQSSFRGIGGDAPRTLAMWVRLPPSTNDQESTQSLSSWGAPGKPGEHWLVGIYNNSQGARLCTEFTGGRVEGRTSIDDGKWHHVVSVFYGGNGGLPANRIEQYIDGLLELSDYKQWKGNDQTKVNTTINQPNSRPLTLGLHPYHKDSTTQSLIDEFYLFDHALTPAEIQLLYRSNRLNDTSNPQK